jgi:hypothetical protein
MTMANKSKGEVGLKVGDKAYTMVFNVNALCLLEDAAGQGVMQIGATMSDPSKMRLGIVRQMLWAGLQTKHAGLTVEEVSAIMDAIGINRAIEVVSQAFALAFPVPEGGGDRPLESKAA